METFEQQFDDALTAIGLGEKRKRAIEAHTEIRETLEGSPELQQLGVKTVLIGSYGRETAIFPGKDVDVFTKLTEADTSHDPATIFNIVRDVLLGHYPGRSEAQPRSIKINFPDDFAVDVVPAVPNGFRWAIPNHDPNLWGREAERWVETDPEKLGELTSQQNREPKIGDRGAYVPTVKLIRQIRRHHLADRKPGGFFFELLTYYAFEKGVTGSSFAEILNQTLRAIVDQLEAGGEIDDPALGTPYSPKPNPDKIRFAAGVFSELAAKAEEALTLERCPAAARWQEIIGRNERGNCFPLPPGCDERGAELKPRTTSVRRPPKKDSGFA
jgi:Second Messenger Oligonucleotide or Dinucleotide Synthetase domain